jgi:tRNA threonylcarbamoyladenosine biosynthesis protein TsaE
MSKLRREIANSAKAMREVGYELAQSAKPGDLFILTGPLGAGKTTLVQGMGKALGIDDITSPTFVISRLHKGRIPLLHVDAYRLGGVSGSSALFDDLDLESYLPTSVTVVEWGSGLAERISPRFTEVNISFGENDQERTVEIMTHDGDQK